MIMYRFISPRVRLCCALSIHNRVLGYDGTQHNIVHLVTTIKAVQRAGRRFVFTDSHPTVKEPLCHFYNQTEDLDKVNWDVMQTKYWGEVKEIKNAREAEFLVFLRLPWESISAIIVHNQVTKELVEGALSEADYAPPIMVEPPWYY